VRRLQRWLPALLVAFAALAAGCRGASTALTTYAVATGGDPDRGEAVIRQVGCGSCHTIPGVRGAAGVVGPPLNFFARRTYIAGEVPASADNLVRWLRNPNQIEPGTAMPNLGLTERQARDVAAYLYTLQ
jgi:cytochrome c2